MDENAIKHDSEILEIPFNAEVEKYRQLLSSFEQLELKIPQNEENYDEFLRLNQICIDKVEKLIVDETDTEGAEGTYFLALLQIKDSLHEQRNLLLNLSNPEVLIDNKNVIFVENNPFLDSLRSVPCANNLSDIIGLSEVKQVLTEAMIYPIKYPQIFQGSRKPWNSILLYGPPGTGKTFIANAIAAEIGAAFYNISSANLLSKYIGESEKLIHEFFMHLSYTNEQNVIFFDEIDSLCKVRSGEEADHTRRVKSQLLTEFQNATNFQKVFIIGATNCPWDMDAAFLRRFQRKLFVPLPNSDERREIISKSTNGSQLQMNPEQWDTILNKTNGYSGSDLTVIGNFVLYEPVKELATTTCWKIREDGFIQPATEIAEGTFTSPIGNINPQKICVRDINFKDFEKALASIPRTTTDADLNKFEQYKSSLF